MDNSKGNDRLNEVLGRRSAADNTACEAGTVNSPFGAEFG